MHSRAVCGIPQPLVLLPLASEGSIRTWPAKIRFRSFKKSLTLMCIAQKLDVRCHLDQTEEQLLVFSHDEGQQVPRETSLLESHSCVKIEYSH